MLLRSRALVKVSAYLRSSLLLRSKLITDIAEHARLRIQISLSRQLTYMKVLLDLEKRCVCLSVPVGAKQGSCLVDVGSHAWVIPVIPLARWNAAGSLTAIRTVFPFHRYGREIPDCEFVISTTDTPNQVRTRQLEIPHGIQGGRALLLVLLPRSRIHAHPLPLRRRCMGSEPCAA